MRKRIYDDEFLYFSQTRHEDAIAEIFGADALAFAKKMMCEKYDTNPEYNLYDLAKFYYEWELARRKVRILCECHKSN